MSQPRPSLLFLTQVLPYPLVGGAKIRAYYMLRTLAQQYAVTLVSFVRDDDRPGDIDHLRQFCHAVHTVPMPRSRWRDGLALLHSLASGRPLVVVRDRVPAMNRLLDQLAQQTSFAAVHADQTAMAEYALRVGRGSPCPPRRILDQHNAMHLLVARQAAYERGPMRRIWQREARLLAGYERGLCRQFDHILTVTEPDRAAHLALFPPAGATHLAHKITAVPICVDPAGTPPIPYQDAGPQILHLGTMFWPPNVEGVLWFATEVLPLVLTQVPDAIFTVAGKQPPPAVQALAEPGSPVHRHVRITGFVADPTTLLATCRAFVVPVRAGGGMRVKIVDGWQWGVPIVSTRIGAEGIETRPGENILLADEPADFAAAVVSLLTDPGRGAQLRQNGRRWVSDHYNWHTIYRRVLDIYELASRSAR